MVAHEYVTKGLVYAPQPQQWPQTVNTVNEQKQIVKIFVANI